MSIVTLLTDFGDRDGFVGALRGVVLGYAPHARLADLAHDLPPGDVAKAACVLRRAAPCFPRGTLHLVVVDPGVGTDRRALAGRDRAGHLYVAPDNGALEPFLDEMSALVEVVPGRAVPAPRSATFHGRDLFAPVAGVLAAGGSLDSLGPPVSDPVRLPWVAPVERRGRWEGRVREVDRFGNLITDLPGDLGALGCRVWVGGRSLRGPQRAYGAAAPGELLVVRGSEGTLEVAARGGSAAALLGIGVGAPVTCLPEPSAG